MMTHPGTPSGDLMVFRDDASSLQANRGARDPVVDPGSCEARPGEDVSSKRARQSAGPKPWVKKAALSSSRLDALDEERSEALESWVIILSSRECTKIGRILLEMQVQDASATDIGQVIRDVFADKASGTLRARASSILQFARWRASCRGLYSC